MVSPYPVNLNIDGDSRQLDSSLFLALRVSPPGQPTVTNKNQETRKLGNPHVQFRKLPKRQATET